MDTGTVLPARHKLHVDEFYRMAEAGVFAKEHRIELIEGDLIDMAPIGPDHEAIVSGFNEVFVLALAGRANVWPQNSIRLASTSAPQPDIAILRRRADFYAGARASTADVLLLVEVADSSLHFDRTVKLPLYARAWIAEVWIVDVQRRLVDVHRKPDGTRYSETATYQSNGEIALALAPEIIIKLDLIFGGMA